MDLEQLRHFLKVAELRNFTRAADLVGLSQPALSRSIARLETELGQPVFERQSRHLTLTEAGELLLGRAQQILALVEDTQLEIGDDGQSGRVRVAAIPTIAPFFLPELLKRFRAGFPHASVIVQEDTTDKLLQKLSDGEVDVAIMARPFEARSLDIEDLFEEELLLVLPTDHPLCGKPQIRIGDIESLPFVLLGEAHCLTDNVLSFCRHKAFQPLAIERTSQLATVQELVSLNHGVSLIPAMAQQLDTSPSRTYRSLSGTRPTRKIVMVSNPHRFQSRLKQGFQQLLRSCSQSSPPGRLPARPGDCRP